MTGRVAPIRDGVFRFKVPEGTGIALKRASV